MLLINSIVLRSILIMVMILLIQCEEYHLKMLPPIQFRRAFKANSIHNSVLKVVKIFLIFTGILWYINRYICKNFWYSSIFGQLSFDLVWFMFWFSVYIFLTVAKIFVKLLETYFVGLKDLKSIITIVRVTFGIQVGIQVGIKIHC